jgi:hypothetical protein
MKKTIKMNTCKHKWINVRGEYYECPFCRLSLVFTPTTNGMFLKGTWREGTDYLTVTYRKLMSLDEVNEWKRKRRKVK